MVDVVRPQKKSGRLWGMGAYEFNSTTLGKLELQLINPANEEIAEENAKEYWKYYWENPNEFSAFTSAQKAAILRHLNPKEAAFPPTQRKAFINAARYDDELREKLYKAKQFVVNYQSLKTYLKTYYLNIQGIVDRDLEFELQTLPPSQLIILAKDDREIALAICKNPSLLSLNIQNQRKYLLDIYKLYPRDLEIASVVISHGVLIGQESNNDKNINSLKRLKNSSPNALDEFFSEEKNAQDAQIDQKHSPALDKKGEADSKPHQHLRNNAKFLTHPKTATRYLAQWNENTVSAVLAHHDNPRIAFRLVVNHKHDLLLQSGILERAAQDDKKADAVNVRKLLFVEQNNTLRDAANDGEIAALLGQKNNRRITRRIIATNPERIVDLVRLAGASDSKDAQGQHTFATQLVNNKALYLENSETLYNHAFSALASHIDSHASPNLANRWLDSVKKAFGRFAGWVREKTSHYHDHTKDPITQRTIHRVVQSDLLRGKVNFARGNTVLGLLADKNLDPRVCETIAMDRNLWRVVKTHHGTDQKLEDLYKIHPVFIVQDSLGGKFGKGNLQAYRFCIAQWILGSSAEITLSDNRIQVLSPNSFIKYYDAQATTMLIAKDRILFDIVITHLTDAADDKTLLKILFGKTASEFTKRLILGSETILNKMLPQNSSKSAKAVLDKIIDKDPTLEGDIAKVLLPRIINNLDPKELYNLTVNSKTLQTLIKNNTDFRQKLLKDINKIIPLINKIFLRSHDEKDQKIPAEESARALLIKEVHHWLHVYGDKEKTNLSRVLKETSMLDVLLSSADAEFINLLFSLDANNKCPLLENLLDSAKTHKPLIISNCLIPLIIKLAQSASSPSLKDFAINLIAQSSIMLAPKDDKEDEPGATVAPSDDKEMEQPGVKLSASAQLRVALIEKAQTDPALIPVVVAVCAKDPHFLDNARVKALFTNPNTAEDRFPLLLTHDSLKLEAVRLITAKGNQPLALKLATSKNPVLQELLLFVCKTQTSSTNNPPAFRFDLFTVLLTVQEFTIKNSGFIWSVITDNRGEFKNRLQQAQLTNLLTIQDLEIKKKISDFISESPELQKRLKNNNSQFDSKEHTSPATIHQKLKSANSSIAVTIETAPSSAQPIVYPAPTTAVHPAPPPASTPTATPKPAAPVQLPSSTPTKIIPSF